jgi:hypothetical protein
MPQGSDGTGPGQAGSNTSQGGGGGAGKLIVRANVLDDEGATLVPSPISASACALVGFLQPKK